MVSATVGLLLPAAAGDRTWIDGALAARDELKLHGIEVDTRYEVPDRLPSDWDVAVCHGIQYQSLLASRPARQRVILSDVPVDSRPVEGVTYIDWNWHQAFFCAGYLASSLADDAREIVFLAGTPVPTQRKLVDSFLRGMDESGSAPLPVHVTFLPRFDDTETAVQRVRSSLAGRKRILYVSSSDVAGAQGLEIARAAGAPTVSFLTGLMDGDVASVTSDIAGILSRLVRDAADDHPLPPRYTASLSDGGVDVAIVDSAPVDSRHAMTRVRSMLAQADSPMNIN